MRLLVATLLVMPLLGCPPNPTPPPSAGTQAERDADWWIGPWVIDVDALMQQAKADGLSPQAQQIADALARQAAPQYRYELAADGMRRKTPSSDDIVPVTIRVLNPDTVQIEAGSAGRLRIRRAAGGITITDNTASFPVRRPPDR